MGKVMRMRADPRYAAGLRDLISLASTLLGGRRDLKVVEVGVYAGESTKIFLDSGVVAEMVCVDPWKPYRQDGRALRCMAFPEDVKAAFDQSAGRDPRVTAIRGTLQEAAGRIPWEPDLVYLDGDHSRAAVARDIETARGLRCRLLGGHDYTPSVALGGVIKAVDAAFGTPGALFVDTSWLVWGKA